ncbi:MAG TPA: hypothetical protein VFS84_01325 [Candidatus Binatia bacterium]|nr:hypothetical protein [Candidatus Binatia bacterium]
MIEVTEFETRTHWRRNRLWTQENGSYSEDNVSHVRSFLAHETWASSGSDVPLNEIWKTQQISPYELLGGMDRWGFFYGLPEKPTSKGQVINVETPSDDWSWCGDPAFPPRIRLKKRISILSHFDG